MAAQLSVSLKGGSNQWSDRVQHFSQIRRSIGWQGRPLDRKFHLLARLRKLAITRQSVGILNKSGNLHFQHGLMFQPFDFDDQPHGLRFQASGFVYQPFGLVDQLGGFGAEL